MGSDIGSVAGIVEWHGEYDAVRGMGDGQADVVGLVVGERCSQKRSRMHQSVRSPPAWTVGTMAAVG